MGHEWKECELGDFIELKRGYDLPKGNRVNGDIPVISSAGFSGFHNESKVSAPGVVTGRYGTIGEVFYVEQDFWPLNTTLYVTDFKGNDPLYVYYFLKTISYSDYVDKAAVPGINRNHLHKAKVRVPVCSKYQHELALRLYSLDKKITLNRQINQTLEQMAQTLFKSWFVDFDPVIDNALDAGNEIPDTLQERAEQRRLLRAKADFKPLPAATRSLFPSEFEETELGWVPKGWDVLSIGDMCDAVTNGGTPNRATKEFWTDGEIPWYKTGEFADGFLLTPSERITHLAVANSSVKLLPENSVLMAIYAAPTVGRLGILTETSAFNQAATGMTPKSSIGTWFLFLTLYFARDWFNNRANGAAPQRSPHFLILK